MTVALCLTISTYNVSLWFSTANSSNAGWVGLSFPCREKKRSVSHFRAFLYPTALSSNDALYLINSYSANLKSPLKPMPQTKPVFCFHYCCIQATYETKKTERHWCLNLLLSMVLLNQSRRTENVQCTRDKNGRGNNGS